MTNLRLVGWGSAVGIVYSGSRVISILSVAMTGHPLDALEAVGSVAALVGGVCVALAVFSPRRRSLVRRLAIRPAGYPPARRALVRPDRPPARPWCSPPAPPSPRGGQSSCSTAAWWKPANACARCDCRNHRRPRSWVRAAAAGVGDRTATESTGMDIGVRAVAGRPAATGHQQGRRGHQTARARRRLHGVRPRPASSRIRPPMTSTSRAPLTTPADGLPPSSPSSAHLRSASSSGLSSWPGTARAAEPTPRGPHWRSCSAPACRWPTSPRVSRPGNGATTTSAAGNSGPSRCSSRLGSVAVASGLLILVGAPRPLIALVLSQLAGLLVVLVITRFWKVSIHCATAGGLLGVLVVLFGPWALLGIVPLAVIAWSRVVLDAHTWTAGRGRRRPRVPDRQHPVPAARLNHRQLFSTSGKTHVAATLPRN